MRTFNELNVSEQTTALDICFNELLDLVRGRIIRFEAAPDLQNKIDEVLNSPYLKPEDTNTALLENFSLIVALKAMASTDAHDAEYPSKNKFGLYNKVIQL